MAQEKTTMTKVEMDDARNGQAGYNRAYVVSVVILAAMLALLVALVAGSAEAELCDVDHTPDCHLPDDPPTNSSYDPVPGGFSWEMPPRYPGLNSDGVTDFSIDSPWHQKAFVQAEDGFQVNFNGCASEVDRYRADLRADETQDTVFTYRWSFPGSKGPSTTFEGPSCKASLTYMQEGSNVVTLTIKDAAGATLGTFEQTVTVKDKLIVAIGDSYGSGEGNPDKPQTYEYRTYPDPLSGMQVRYVVKERPKWADQRCHRSSYAGPAQAARDLEYADPHSSVTFVFLACSGAGIQSGLLGTYPGIEDPGGDPLPAQLDKVHELVGDHQIDALVMSAGGNDGGFADVLQLCLDPRDPSRWHCNEQGNLISERLELLPDRYKALNQRMTDLGLNVAKDNVYLTEYAIGTRGDALEGYCGSNTMSFFEDPLLSNMTLAEVQYVTENMAQPLNRKMEEAAQTLGWTYVRGINSEFSHPLGEQSHGFCSEDPWVRTMLKSNEVQGPQTYFGEAWSNPSLWQATTGTMHPNAFGQNVYKERILNAISGATSPGPTLAASEPEYAPGRVVVRVKATNPSGIVSDSVSVNATGACQVEGITCTTRRLDGQTLEWTLEVARAGLHTFEFRATDGDGQESSFVHEVEFLPSGPPIISGPTDNSYDTDGSVTLFGAAEAGSTISLFEEGNPEPVGSATVDGSNAWSLTLTGLAEGPHSYAATATNSSGLTSVASTPVRVSVDTTKPTITINSPTEGASYKLGGSVTAEYSCSDNASSGSDLSCTGSVPNSSALDTRSVGPKTFTVTSTDKAGNTETKTVNYSVVYDFGKGSGGSFGEPVRETELNQLKAGAGVPVKFGLGGDFGLSIFAIGYPTSKKIACNTGLPVDPIEETAAITNSGLKYDAAAGHYVYGWKTDKTWSGTCRELNVKLADGTDHPVKFQFK
jgi:hypothetical protein